MKLGLWLLLALLGGPVFSQEQIAERKGAPFERPPEDYQIIGATPAREALLRAQIGMIQPEVLPRRVIFVPHWKYLDDARIMRLHLPTGFASVMFTHLPSRSVYIDDDRYQGAAWMGRWMAHELGHLAMNSAREEDAEKVASKYIKRLRIRSAR